MAMFMHRNRERLDGHVHTREEGETRWPCSYMNRNKERLCGHVHTQLQTEARWPSPCTGIGRGSMTVFIHV